MGVYVCGAAVAVERGRYWRGKRQQNHHRPTHIHTSSYTSTQTRTHTHHTGGSTLWGQKAWIVCVSVCVCVCSPAAGFMPHRVSLPAR